MRKECRARLGGQAEVRGRQAIHLNPSIRASRIAGRDGLKARPPPVLNLNRAIRWYVCHCSRVHRSSSVPTLPISPISLVCPFCKARPGRDCTTTSGVFSAIHVARIKAAAKTLWRCWCFAFPGFSSIVIAEVSVQNPHLQFKTGTLLTSKDATAVELKAQSAALKSAACLPAGRRYI